MFILLLLVVMWGVAAFKFLLLNITCFGMLKGLIKTEELREFECETPFSYPSHLSFSARLILKLALREMLLFLLLLT